MEMIPCEKSSVSLCVARPVQDANEIFVEIVTVMIALPVRRYSNKIQSDSVPLFRF